MQKRTTISGVSGQLRRHGIQDSKEFFPMPFRRMLRLFTLMFCLLSLVPWPISHFYAFGLAHIGRGMQSVSVNSGKLRIAWMLDVRAEPQWRIIKLQVEESPVDPQGGHILGFVFTDGRV